MGSSSKTKSSKRKNSSKLSSKARKMKKSRRTKSKKLGRRHDSSTDDSMSSHSILPGNDSYSSNSDDDSMSSASISRSSSEDTYRTRKSIPRSRGNLKKARKRARRRSSGREGRDKLAPIKKRKRSRKDSDSKTRKKSHRKKRRRDLSASPTSSDSHSCSTCKGSRSDIDESERDRVRSRSREGKRDKRNSHKDNRRTNISFHRSSSHSSHSRSRDQSGSVSYSEERFPSENNSRRLKSIITFAEQASEGEGNKWNKGLQNEESVDNDDYPSRSSSGGGSKKESAPHSPVAVDTEKWIENPKFVSGLVGSLNDAQDINDVETHSSTKESGSFASLVSARSGGDDLEATLRQKALQNLKKFRVRKCNTETTPDQKNEDDGKVNPSTTSKAGVERVVFDGGHTEKVDGIVKQKINRRPDGLGLQGNAKEDGHNSGNPIVGKSVTGTSSLRGRSSGLGMQHQMTASGASPDKIMRGMETNEGTTTTTAQTTSVAGNSSFRETSSGLDTLIKPTISSTSPGKDLMETESTVSAILGFNQGTASGSAALEPALSAPSGGQSLNNEKDEAKDGGLYQKKTMSVMRGGEMVQVNYKVYIPQRTPALARRLKR